MPDPERRCMKPAAWPARDRKAWAAALRDGGFLEDGGLAAHWRPDTRRAITDAYGRFLTFLECHGWLDPDAGPADRLNEDRLRAYAAELVRQVAPITVYGRIRDLAEALRVMVPGITAPYLARARNRLKVRARPTRNKRARIVPTQALIALGADLIEQAEKGDAARESWRACTYRDGVLILMLATRPIRRSNLAAMRIGQELVRIGDRYEIRLPGTMTKNHRDYDRPLPPCLTPLIDRWLDQYRPILLEGREDDHVWISWRGRRLSDDSLTHKVCQQTRKAFGHAVSPHLFRDCAVTTLGEESPEDVWLAQALLHHSDPRVTEAHYDHARSTAAVRGYQDAIVARRQALRRIDARRPRRRQNRTDSE